MSECGPYRPARRWGVSIERCPECGSYDAECANDKPVPGCGCARCCRAEVERLRMQLVACGVVAMANTPESAVKARGIHPDYRSVSCDDVARAVDREMSARAEAERLREALVVARNYVRAVEGQIITQPNVVTKDRELCDAALRGGRCHRCATVREEAKEVEEEIESGFSETTEESHTHYCPDCGSTWSHADESCMGPRFVGYYGQGFACPLCED